MTDEHVKRLAEAAPVLFDTATVDWDGIGDALAHEHINPAAVLAATWCRFSTDIIQALVDLPCLVLVHPEGIIATNGKRKLLSKRLKYETVTFSGCRNYGPLDYEDGRGGGKYCIEFSAAGSVMLGRLEWAWRAKRFRDNRKQVIAVAEERDRILTVLAPLISLS